MQNPLDSLFLLSLTFSFEDKWLRMYFFLSSLCLGFFFVLYFWLFFFVCFFFSRDLLVVLSFSQPWENLSVLK